MLCVFHSLIFFCSFCFALTFLFCFEYLWQTKRRFYVDFRAQGHKTLPRSLWKLISNEPEKRESFELTFPGPFDANKFTKIIFHWVLVVCVFFVVIMIRYMCTREMFYCLGYGWDGIGLAWICGVWRALRGYTKIILLYIYNYKLAKLTKL